MKEEVPSLQGLLLSAIRKTEGGGGWKRRRGKRREEKRRSALYLSFSERFRSERHKQVPGAMKGALRKTWRFEAALNDPRRSTGSPLQGFIMIIGGGKQLLKKKIGFDGPTVCCRQSLQSLFWKLLRVKKKQQGKGGRNYHNSEAWGSSWYVTDSL